MSQARLNAVLQDQGLTPREQEVSYLVSQGNSNKEIAEELGVTEVTVKFHLQNIFKKMELKSRAQLIVFCLPHIVFPELTKNPDKKLDNWIKPKGEVEEEETPVTAKPSVKQKRARG